MPRASSLRAAAFTTPPLAFQRPLSPLGGVAERSQNDPRSLSGLRKADLIGSSILSRLWPAHEGHGWETLSAIWPDVPVLRRQCGGEGPRPSGHLGGCDRCGTLSISDHPRGCLLHLHGVRTLLLWLRASRVPIGKLRHYRSRRRVDKPIRPHSLPPHLSEQLGRALEWHRIVRASVRECCET
jgi:hypothetical protein